jgi:thiosulfate/3-mercaptopyruvate sulfurtransferase
VARVASPRPLTVTTAELRLRLTDETVAVVDTRPQFAFNGWQTRGEARGGHIPGAASFPAAWLDRLDADEARLLLGSNEITPEREVVLYGAGDPSELRKRFAALGYERVVGYPAGWAEWAADPALPAQRLANFDKLVHPEWLRRALAGGRPEAPSGRVLVFHVNFGVPEEYEEDHLPQALYLDTNLLESPVDWNRRSPAELDAALRSLGITHDTTVVLYGRDTEGHAEEKWPGRRAGQIAACRAALILRYAGVDDVRVLDGGYDHWVRAGYPLERTVRRPTPVTSFGVPVPLRPDLIVDLTEAKQILADPDGAALVSVRTWAEHTGRVSGYNYIGPAGRIAGDVWGNCGTDAYHMQHYRTVDNTMRPYPEITANWSRAGISADKWVAFYCGTGWRASETWFYAYLMGWSRVAVYDGGWFEWSRDPRDNPIEVGEPPTEIAA